MIKIHQKKKKQKNIDDIIELHVDNAKNPTHMKIKLC